MTNNQGCETKVPSITEIQEILVQLEDKPKTFLKSRQWIGSFEVESFLCIFCEYSSIYRTTLGLVIKLKSITKNKPCPPFQSPLQIRLAPTGWRLSRKFRCDKYFSQYMGPGLLSCYSPMA